MREYIEIQARKKAHDLVLFLFKDEAIGKVRNKIAGKLKDAVSNVPADLFEAHARYSNTEKIKYLSKARGYLYETKYYIELLADLEKISTGSKKSYTAKINLLDKMIVAMIKEAQREKYPMARINYFHHKVS